MAILLPLAALSISAAPPNPADELMSYLDRTIDWQRQITSLDQTPISSQDVVLREAVQQSARQALQLGFTAARAQAAMLDFSNPTSAPASAKSKNLAQAAATANQRIAQLQAQLDEINRQIQATMATSRPVLEGHRDSIASQLNFAKTRQSALQNFVGFMSTLDTSGSAGLLQRIDELQRSTPDLQPPGDAAEGPRAAAAVAADAAKSQDQFREETVGILGLTEEIFTLTNRMTDLSGLINQTKSLVKENENRRTPLRAELQSLTRQGDALSQSPDTDDPNKLAAQRAQFESLNTRLKELAAVAVPLGEQGAVLEATQNSMQEWHTVLGHSYTRLLRSLILRLGVIAVIILLILGFSKIWGMVTLRYVTDIRRRRQFLLMRRIVVMCLVTIIIVASVVSEFGSLATFAGLITAGIAVSLQTVILSGVAYFFFIGRYGVRVGDRVTINNITGDVIDIGLFRLYLMELAGNNRDLHFTGRIVVFSNSVLFQPNAFFKQLPGSDYVWHEVALTLSPQTDHLIAEKRLLGAVQSVYDTYGKRIEAQYRQLRDKVHLPIAEPKPEGRLRLVDAGLEYVIRYPVELHGGAEADDAITRKLLQTIEEEPKLRMVPTGTPRIQPAAVEPLAKPA
jgi:small-conductance mechanosensitive channel